MKMSAKIFNFRLFIEALKRLRVIGLATAILSVTASALIPIVMWMESKDWIGVYDMETELLCIPVGFVTFLAPFFFFVLFSFLQKRKESDFFHAIPYTRTCVYVSFVTASLAFVWAIQITCGLTAGILWKLNPHVLVDLGGMAVYVLICMLASSMLCSFMMLALTVSGTAGSCMLLFVLFAGFVRIVAAIWGGCISNIDLLSMEDAWMDTFVSPLWFLPINILYYFSDVENATHIMYSLPNILYTTIVTLAVYALAGLIYKHRKSEMAGNPAPGTKTQALFRIMFTLLPSLLIPLFLFEGTDEPSLHLVLVVGILLVYFLYELITTKRPRNMLKAIPGLGIVVAVCILFSLAYVGYRDFVLNEEITPDEIKTVSVESNGLGTDTYQSRIMDEFRTNDPEVVQIVADQLAESQEAEREVRYSDFYWNRTSVTIHLKSGRTLRRNIILLDEDANSILGNLRKLEAVQEVLYSLPEDHEIDSGNFYIDIAGHYTDYCLFGNIDMTEFMKVFRDEFSTLTMEQKERIMAPTFRFREWQEGGMTLSLRGEVNGQHYYSRYVVTEDMPRSRDVLLSYWIRDTYNSFERGDSQWYGSVNSFAALSLLQNSMEDPQFMDFHEYVTVSLYASSIENMGQKGADFDCQYIRVKTEQLPALIDLLLARDLWPTEARLEGDSITVTENTYGLRIVVEGDRQDYSRLYLESSGLYNLTAEDWQTICDLLGIKNTMR